MVISFINTINFLDWVTKVMRQVGVIPNSELANRFAEYLRATGIACTVDRTENGSIVWVHDDDMVANAKAELPNFLANPNDERYRAAMQQATDRARIAIAERAASRGKTIYVADRWNRPIYQIAPLTIVLVAISVVLSLMMGFPPKIAYLRWLLISTDGTMRQIMSGEVWRLVSPIFLHFSQAHLIFNMLNLWYFGRDIESRIGTFRYLIIVLVTAIFSNMAQFIAVDPVFGGMSGVVYGLFGYIWVKSKMDPESGFWLPQSTVVIMLLWHVACVAGIIQNVANWCHGGGLVAGVTIAFVGVMLKPVLRRK